MKAQAIGSRQAEGEGIMDRRGFLKACAVGIGAVAGLGSARALASAGRGRKALRPEAQLRLGSQEWLIPGGSLREKAANLEKYGGTGLEVGDRDLPGRVKEIREALAGTKVRVSAVCAAGGPYIVPDESARKARMENAKTLLSAAADLGSTGVIMVPAFNNAADQLAGRPARDLLLQVLAELGEHAERVGSRVLIEPLNRGEAFFLRQLADAASICRDANSPGVAMMGDFYHMRFEETSDMGAFLSAGAYLRHVHLGSASRKLPGQDDRSFVDGFRGLRAIGYRDFLSLECSVKGDPEEEIPASFRFLKKQWKEAGA